MRPVALGILALVTSGWAAAADRPNQYVSVQGLYTDPDEQRGADYGLGVSLSFAGRLGRDTFLELRAVSNTLETGETGTQDFYQYGLGIDFVTSFGDETGGHLYTAFGGGGMRNDVVPNTKDETSGYGDAAFGWRFAPLANWSARPRLEVRATYDTFDEGVADIAVSFGFDILPRADRVVEKVVEKIVEVPKIVEKVVEVPVERIVEKEVIREVEPVDADGDGVYDARDKCPDTLKGAKVDPDGCVRVAQTITLPNIEFQSAKVELTEKGTGTLEAVVKFMQSQPDVVLEIVGHTDSQGPDAYNMTLSEGRARAVLTFLITKGIAAERVTSKGMGESQPVANNATKEGRAQNRRVELRIRGKTP
jgi:OOP family OmpA-OmpF porin